MILATVEWPIIIIPTEMLTGIYRKRDVSDLSASNYHWHAV